MHIPKIGDVNETMVIDVLAYELSQTEPPDLWNQRSTDFKSLRALLRVDLLASLMAVCTDVSATMPGAVQRYDNLFEQLKPLYDEHSADGGAANTTQPNEDRLLSGKAGRELQEFMLARMMSKPEVIDRDNPNRKSTVYVGAHTALQPLDFSSKLQLKKVAVPLNPHNQNHVRMFERLAAADERTDAEDQFYGRKDSDPRIWPHVLIPYTELGHAHYAKVATAQNKGEEVVVFQVSLEARWRKWMGGGQLYATHEQLSVNLSSRAHLYSKVAQIDIEERLKKSIKVGAKTNASRRKGKPDPQPKEGTVHHIRTTRSARRSS